MNDFPEQIYKWPREPRFRTQIAERRQWGCPRCNELHSTPEAAQACLDSHGPLNVTPTNEDR